MFLKVVSFNQMSRRHIDGLTRMEVTLPTSSIQTTLSFPQRLMWVNVLDGFPFFWWHMVFLKRCCIMFVFILPKTRCVSRNFTFNSLANTGGMRLGWRVAALHWSTWQNDARNSELSLGGLAQCTMCKYLNLLLLFRWTQIWNTQLSTSMCWMENTISRASKY